MPNLTIPCVIFAYSRPDELRQTLGSLRENAIPKLYAFSDGPRTSSSEKRVLEVRKILHEIDWCETILVERDVNFGLGRSILEGVSEVLKCNDSAIIFEDDLICVPGTYSYICAALENYRNSPQVMSITGWTHPALTPSDVIEEPYFDGRAECWVWGTWARAWNGMENTAKSLIKMCQKKNIDIYAYGADLVEMARMEQKLNIWAVRFLYWHIFNKGLCLRPPWSMVQNIGFSKYATNTKESSFLTDQEIKKCPSIPQKWPQPKENPECKLLYKKIYGSRPTLKSRLVKFGKRIARKTRRVISALPR